MQRNTTRIPVAILKPGPIPFINADGPLSRIYLLQSTIDCIVRAIGEHNVQYLELLHKAPVKAVEEVKVSEEEVVTVALETSEPIVEHVIEEDIVEVPVVEPEVVVEEVKAEPKPKPKQPRRKKSETKVSENLE